MASSTAPCARVGVRLNGRTVCAAAESVREREGGQTERFTHAWAIHSPITAVSTHTCANTHLGASAASATVHQSDVGIKGESHRSDTFQIRFVFEENAADRKVAQSCARLFESEIPGFIGAYNDKKRKAAK